MVKTVCICLVTASQHVSLLLSVCRLPALTPHTAHICTHKVTQRTLTCVWKPAAIAGVAYFVYHMLIVQMRLFSLKFANKVIANADPSVWEGGRPPRPLHASILKGAKGKKPKQVGKMRQPASDMAKFALAR